MKIDCYPAISRHNEQTFHIIDDISIFINEIQKMKNFFIPQITRAFQRAIMHIDNTSGIWGEKGGETSHVGQQTPTIVGRALTGASDALN